MEKASEREQVRKRVPLRLCLLQRLRTAFQEDRVVVFYALNRVKQ